MPCTPDFKLIPSPSVLPDELMVFLKIEIAAPFAIAIKSSWPFINQLSSIITLMAFFTLSVPLALPEASGPPVLSICVHFMVIACAVSH